jgi:Helicase associated domain
VCSAGLQVNMFFFGVLRYLNKSRTPPKAPVAVQPEKRSASSVWELSGYATAKSMIVMARSQSARMVAICHQQPQEWWCPCQRTAPPLLLGVRLLVVVCFACFMVPASGFAIGKRQTRLSCDHPRASSGGAISFVATLFDYDFDHAAAASVVGVPVLRAGGTTGALRMSSSSRRSGTSSSPLSQKQQQQQTTTMLGWNFRIRQLRQFRQQNGHTRVPRRHTDPPGLANWVNKQRQLYKRYRNGTRPCSLDERRIAELEGMGFCWDGRQPPPPPAAVTADSASSSASSSSIQQKQEQSDIVWWQKWKELQLSNVTADEIHAFSGLGKWLREQRRSFLVDHTLSEVKRRAMDQLDAHWWMTHSQRAWERQFQMLAAYAAATGHCQVPISYPNRRLAHFVANQRKQYNMRVKKQKSSAMTEERIRRLESLGFVWNHWDHELQRKERNQSRASVQQP